MCGMCAHVHMGVCIWLHTHAAPAVCLCSPLGLSECEARLGGLSLGLSSVHSQASGGLVLPGVSVTWMGLGLPVICVLREEGTL